ncbi:hypothetical protein L6452_26592 [Arctium lappa]|uniref:Uncharacterized protein n=1 Tax=Arctium lappa TaxID=4217 RepID=A0ACB8ZUU3_ARCLA|nr:hypothetical protein L6452_26592 [Arctium lappa]
MSAYIGCTRFFFRGREPLSINIFMKVLQDMLSLKWLLPFSAIGSCFDLELSSICLLVIMLLLLGSSELTALLFMDFIFASLMEIYFNF